MNDEIVQYYVVNKDIPMSAGKMSAQVAHAATIAAVDLLHREQSAFADYFDYFVKWYQGGMKKIVLKASQADLEQLAAERFYAIHDSGLTEVPSGSLTVVALPPMPKAEAQKFVKGFSLC